MFCSLALGLSLVPACPGRNENHCYVKAGDDTCEALYPDLSRPFCEVACLGSPGDNGCVAARPTDACYSPCGNEMTLEECRSVADEGTTGSTEPVETGSTTDDAESTETGEPNSSSEGPPADESTTAVPECTGTEPCNDLANPLCVDGACVPCTETEDGNAACQTLDPNLPVCAGGVCVLCTLGNQGACADTTTPICDVEGPRCICTEHEQCGTGDQVACHIEAGTCFPNDPDDVLHVGEGQVFESLCDLASNPALAEVDEGEQAVVVLHGTTNFDEACTLEGNRVVAFKMASDADLDWIQSNTDQAPTLTLGNGAIAYLDGLRFLANTQGDEAVLALQGAIVYLRRSEISGNQGLAISADNARVFVDRSRIVGNGGGIEATGGSTVTLTNVFVSGPNDVSAVTIDGSTLEMRYVSAGAAFGDARALQCLGTSTVRIRNSLLLSRGDLNAVDCTGAIVDTSAMSGVLVDVTGTGNTQGVVVNPDWFSNYNGGDFHLVDGHPFNDVAVWQDGDPLTDIDGDLRPGIPGPDVAGADVPTNP